MTGLWNYKDGKVVPYGDDTTYAAGMKFLDGHGTVEDWGCGATYAKKFVDLSPYRGIDGTPSPHTAQVVDLRGYRSNADCIFMRHILEHNHDWRQIMENALASFQNRMTLIIFTPFIDETKQIHTNWSAIPDIAFKKSDLTDYFKKFKWSEQTFQTVSQYKTETIFFLERSGLGGKSPDDVGSPVQQ